MNSSSGGNATIRNLHRSWDAPCGCMFCRAGRNAVIKHADALRLLAEND